MEEVHTEVDLMVVNRKLFLKIKPTFTYIKSYIYLSDLHTAVDHMEVNHMAVEGKTS